MGITKPAWQRLIVMAELPSPGFRCADLLMVLLLMANRTCQESYHGITCDSLALEMGLQNGDKILSLDGQYVENFAKVPIEIILNEVQTIQVERDGQQIDVETDSSSAS